MMLLQAEPACSCQLQSYKRGGQVAAHCSSVVHLSWQCHTSELHGRNCAQIFDEAVMHGT